MTHRIIELRRPDDWHVHLRDGELLRAVAPHTARVFGRAVVMPNLSPPVTTAAAASSYRQRIAAALPRGCAFEPLMTLYLTDTTPADEVERAFAGGQAAAVKLYPAHATTNSAHGVSDLERVDPVLDRMAAIGMPLLVHGEVTDAETDVFDREAVFIERVLGPLRLRHPRLKIVLEHITTEEAVELVTAQPPASIGEPGSLGATVTAHHLFLNRTDLFRGGLRPHHYCLPVAKRERHRIALRRAVTSGHPALFLGTDSAPHTRRTKECDRGCAGVYTAANAIELYAQAFDELGALDRLEAFASVNGPRFYGLPLNDDTIQLARAPGVAPAPIELTGDAIIAFMPSGGVGFRLSDRPSIHTERRGED